LKDLVGTPSPSAFAPTDLVTMTANISKNPQDFRV
jgi:hypothetical protein